MVANHLNSICNLVKNKQSSIISKDDIPPFLTTKKPSSTNWHCTKHDGILDLHWFQAWLLCIVSFRLLLRKIIKKMKRKKFLKKWWMSV